MWECLQRQKRLTINESDQRYDHSSNTGFKPKKGLLAVARHDRMTFTVASESDAEIEYLVDMEENGGVGWCGCQDFEFRHQPQLIRRKKGYHRCKHIRAVITFLGYDPEKKERTQKGAVDKNLASGSQGQGAAPLAPSAQPAPSKARTYVLKGSPPVYRGKDVRVPGVQGGGDGRASHAGPDRPASDGPTVLGARMPRPSFLDWSEC